jgi:hypothetical protein
MRMNLIVHINMRQMRYFGYVHACMSCLTSSYTSSQSWMMMYSTWWRSNDAWCSFSWHMRHIHDPKLGLTLVLTLQSCLVELHDVNLSLGSSYLYPYSNMCVLGMLMDIFWSLCNAFMYQSVIRHDYSTCSTPKWIYEHILTCTSARRTPELLFLTYLPD